MANANIIVAPEMGKTVDLVYFRKAEIDKFLGQDTREYKLGTTEVKLKEGPKEEIWAQIPLATGMTCLVNIGPKTWSDWTQVFGVELPGIKGIKTVAGGRPGTPESEIKKPKKEAEPKSQTVEAKPL